MHSQTNAFVPAAGINFSQVLRAALVALLWISLINQALADAARLIYFVADLPVRIESQLLLYFAIQSAAYISLVTLLLLLSLMLGGVWLGNKPLQDWTEQIIPTVAMISAGLVCYALFASAGVQAMLVTNLWYSGITLALAIAGAITLLLPQILPRQVTARLDLPAIYLIGSGLVLLGLLGT